MTLDEWKKLQGERQKPQYNLRKAGEGEDLTQWKNMRELQKKKDEKFLENGRGNEKNHAGNNEIEKVIKFTNLFCNFHFHFRYLKKNFN